MQIKQSQEHKKEVVGRLKAHAKDGSERWIEETVVSSRTLGADGNWSAWTTPHTEFWCDGNVCIRQNETEFVPLMTEELLVLDER